MDATATAPPSSQPQPFGMDSKFDLATLLKNVAAAAAASTAAATTAAATTVAVASTMHQQQMATTLTSSTATSPNSVESSVSTNGAPTTSPSPPNPAVVAASVADMKPISAASLAPPGLFQRRQLPFSPIKPSYAPSGHGRQILVYDSRSHPGRRREFAYKTRFTNQSGLTTVYYRCMACRALRHRLQRVLPKEKLPALQVPCIAVKNDLLINDPDFPDASDHFCSPLTIEESNQRLQNTFERGHKRARMKMANSAVEETIRKVGRLSAAAEEGGGNVEQAEAEGYEEMMAAEEGGGSGALSIDLWTRSADAATTMELNGGGGAGDASDCSSDSLVVDVLKDESSPDEYEQHGMMTKEANGAANHRMTNNINANMFISSSASATPPPTSAAMKYMADTNGSATASTSAAPKTPGRSPRKKLDALLRMAEARAAANGQAVKAEQEDGAGGAENGDGGGGTQTQQRMGAGQADGGATSSSSSSSGYSSSSTNVSSASNNGRQGQQIHHQPVLNSLGGLLTPSAPHHFPVNTSSSSSSASLPHSHHFPSHNSHPAPHHNGGLTTSANNIAASMQSIHAIASRLSRSGPNATSELSKALGSKGQQKGGGGGGGMMMNGSGGGEKTGGSGGMMTQQQQQQQMLNALMMGGGNGQQQQQMGPLMVGELLKKYVENNGGMVTDQQQLLMTAENASMNNGGAARSAGELACAMFMAQMVENAELRQEVQKLRAELDSLKTLVAAAAVVSGGNNGTAGGHHRLAH